MTLLRFDLEFHFLLWKCDTSRALESKCSVLCTFQASIFYSQTVGEPIRTSGHIEPSHFDMWDVDARVRVLGGSMRVHSCTQEA